MYRTVTLCHNNGGPDLYMFVEITSEQATRALEALEEIIDLSGKNPRVSGMTIRNVQNGDGKAALGTVFLSEEDDDILRWLSRDKGRFESLMEGSAISAASCPAPKTILSSRDTMLHVVPYGEVYYSTSSIKYTGENRPESGSIDRDTLSRVASNTRP